MRKRRKASRLLNRHNREGVTYQDMRPSNHSSSARMLVRALARPRHLRLRNTSSPRRMEMATLGSELANLKSVDLPSRPRSIWRICLHRIETPKTEHSPGPGTFELLAGCFQRIYRFLWQKARPYGQIKGVRGYFQASFFLTLYTFSLELTQLATLSGALCYQYT